MIFFHAGQFSVNFFMAVMIFIFQLSQPLHALKYRMIFQDENSKLAHFREQELSIRISLLGAIIALTLNIF
jgi:hypothetical protein